MVDHISSMDSYVLVDGEQLQADLFDIIFPLGEYDEQSRYLEIATQLVPAPELFKELRAAKRTDVQCYSWLDPEDVLERALTLGLGMSKAERLYRAIHTRLQMAKQTELLLLWCA